MLCALRWPSIKNQLLVRDATMLYKIVNGLAPPYLECYVNKRSAIHSYNTRSRDNLVVPFCRTATAQRSFSYREITAWNSLLSEETKNSATLLVFKRAVKSEIYNSLWSHKTMKLTQTRRRVHVMKPVYLSDVWTICTDLYGFEN